MANEIKFPPKWKKKYAKMEVEDIIKEIKSRNKYVADSSITECAIWLKNKSLK